MGPGLFLIYVNCVAASLGCRCRAFADDFKLDLSFSRKSCISVFQGMMQLQRDLDKICSVAKSWNLHLNISKYVAMRFGEKKSHIIPSYYNISGKFLEFVAVHRSLGVKVDYRLRFHEHVREVVRKARSLA